MIDASEASRRLLAWLGPSPAMQVDGCRLSAGGTHWILSANTVGYLRDGDVSQALVGVGAYLVDVESGVIEVLGTSVLPEVELEDRRFRAEDGTRVWVIRPTGSDAASIVRLRQFLSCSPAEARELARRKVWFTADRRGAAEARRVFGSLGLPVEIERVEADPSPSLTWVPIDEEGLRTALHARIGRGV